MPTPDPGRLYQFPRAVYESATTEAQRATESEVAPFFVDLASLSTKERRHLQNVGLLPPTATDDVTSIRLLRTAHCEYLASSLGRPLAKGFVSLDASHPWMVYWCLHSLDLLGYFDTLDTHHDTTQDKQDTDLQHKAQLLKRIVSTLAACWTQTPLDFHHDQVQADERLKMLWQQQQKTSTGSTNTCQNIPNDTSGSHRNTSGKHQSTISNQNPPIQHRQQPSQQRFVSIIGGGFGGGPQQMPHCASTYAAVLSLSIVASIGLTTMDTNHPYYQTGHMALEYLMQWRLPLYAFFLSLRVDSEDDHITIASCPQNHDYLQQKNHLSTLNDHTSIAFRMQHDGEVDVRASYCILAPCYLLGLLHSSKDSSTNALLSPSISRHIASCQTYEGGFGAEPYNEAHGGYTFCAVAALRILNSIPSINIPALRSWLSRRQMEFEGGFCGRTNKLVDGCYSFWQGGAAAVLDGWYLEISEREKEVLSNTTLKEDWNASLPVSDLEREVTFNELLLQRYILLCAQDVNGGLRDKPSKPRDFYHSCYNLSGLSVAQHAVRSSWPLLEEDEPLRGDNVHLNQIFGDKNFNVVGRTDPVLNIRVERVKFMLSQHFLA